MASGKVEIQPIYEEVKAFYKNYACVKAEKGWGIISTERQGYIIEPQYINILISKDQVWVQDNIGMWGIRKYDGTQIQVCQYQSITFWESVIHQNQKIAADWDTLLFKQNNILGLMTRNGELLKTLPYQYIYPFTEGSKYTVVATGEYSLSSFSGFYYKQFGVIDFQGNEIIPCVYDDLGEEWKEMCSGKIYKMVGKDNKIWVRLGKDCAHYNFKGEIIAPFKPCN